MRDRNTMNIKKSKGFTFVEVMVVAGILSVVGLALGVAVNNGLTIWSRINDIVLEEDIAIFLERFTADINNVIQYKGIGFEGKDIMFSAPGLIVSEDGRVLPGRFSYYFDERKMTINRRSADVIQLYQAKEDRLVSKILLSNVAKVRFMYYLLDRKNEIYTWMEEWGVDKWGIVDESSIDLPSAVRIQVTLMKGREEIKYAKTVDIPIAKTEYKEK